MQSPQTGDRTCISCIGRQSLYHWATRKSWSHGFWCFLCFILFNAHAKPRAKSSLVLWTWRIWGSDHTSVELQRRTQSDRVCLTPMCLALETAHVGTWSTVHKNLTFMAAAWHSATPCPSHCFTLTCSFIECFFLLNIAGMLPEPLCIHNYSIWENKNCNLSITTHWGVKDLARVTEKKSFYVLALRHALDLELRNP